MGTGKRWTGSAYTDLATKKRWTGSAWTDITIAKRWDGSAWQDIFASGGSNLVTIIEDFEDTTYNIPWSSSQWFRATYTSTVLITPDLWYNDIAMATFTINIPTGATNATVTLPISGIFNGLLLDIALNNGARQSYTTSPIVLPLQTGTNKVDIIATGNDIEDYWTANIDNVKVEYTNPHIVKLESFADSTYEFPVSGGSWTSSGHYMSAGVDGGTDSCSFTINIPVGAKNATVDWDFDVYGQDTYSYGSTVNGANRASKTSLNVGNNDLSFYIQNDGYDYEVAAYITFIKVEYDL